MAFNDGGIGTPSIVDVNAQPPTFALARVGRPICSQNVAPFGAPRRGGDHGLPREFADLSWRPEIVDKVDGIVGTDDKKFLSAV